MKWAIDVAPEVSDIKGNEYISKMQQGYQEIYAPCTDIDLASELNKDEQVFWSKAFQIVAHQLFGRTIGSADPDNWRPSAIVDAVAIARMLQKLCGEYLDYTEAKP